MSEQPDSKVDSAARAGAVLVVDDDPQLCDVVRWLLEDEGLKVETATDGQQAIERATRSRPLLIVLDMGLPIMSGEAVAAALRAFYPKPPPIVVLTASGRAAELAQRVGAVDYLHKPFELDELARVVNQALAASPC
jgi:CheY-like chemotaxis protein